MAQPSFSVCYINHAHVSAFSHISSSSWSSSSSSSFRCHVHSPSLHDVWIGVGHLCDMHNVQYIAYNQYDQYGMISKMLIHTISTNTYPTRQKIIFDSDNGAAACDALRLGHIFIGFDELHNGCEHSIDTHRVARCSILARLSRRESIINRICYFYNGVTVHAATATLCVRTIRECWCSHQTDVHIYIADPYKLCRLFATRSHAFTTQHSRNSRARVWKLPYSMRH